MQQMMIYWGSEMCAHISLPDCPEPQQLQPGQKTTGSDTQFCSPDDERKDARNMLRNNWLPINHHLLHPVGLAFICLYKMHGHSNIKFLNLMSFPLDKNICSVTYFRFCIPNLMITENRFSCKTLIFECRVIGWISWNSVKEGTRWARIPCEPTQEGCSTMLEVGKWHT